MDTRITFALSDDNVLEGPESTVQGRQSTTIPTLLPSDDNQLSTDQRGRDNGFENLTHLVLYTHQPGFLAGLDTEAALVIRAEILDEIGRSFNDGIKLSDDGSYIRVAYDVDEHNTLSLTTFPISADRFRLGYSYDISWGGSRIFRSAASPGLKFDWKSEAFSAFVGAKGGVTQVTVSDGTLEEDTVWGLLAGGGIDILGELRMDVAGGFFRRGTIDKQELRLPDDGSFTIARWDAVGGSARVVYHVGLDIPDPIDFRLYRNDPTQRMDVFEEKQYNDSLSFSIESEFSALGQTLQNPERLTSTTLQPAVAADITGKVRFAKHTLQLDAVFRTLSFILFNVPSEPSFVDFSEGQIIRPDFWVRLAYEYFFEKLHLTPGVVFSIRRPASLVGAVNAGNSPPQSSGQQTQIILNEEDRIILDPGDKVKLVFEGKTTARWDLSEGIAAVLEILVRHDRNRRLEVGAEDGINNRLPADPLMLGFNLLVQARF